MSTKPILFKGDMIRSILAGRKTQTRRLVKTNVNLLQPQFSAPVIHCLGSPSEGYNTVAAFRWNSEHDKESHLVKSPYQAGDILWCRETWSRVNDGDKFGYVFRADPGSDDWEQAEEWTWHPSLFMSYDACRLFLRVTQVRVERLQDISKADAIAEGIEQVGRLAGTSTPLWKDYMGGDPLLSPIASYMSLWNKINGADAHLANPFVWVYPFEVVPRPESR